MIIKDLIRQLQIIESLSNNDSSVVEILIKTTKDETYYEVIDAYWTGKSVVIKAKE